MAKRHMKRCSTVTNHQRNTNQTTMKYHLTPVRIAIIKKSPVNAGEAVEKREPSYTVGGNRHWYNHYGEQYGGSLKK